MFKPKTANKDYTQAMLPHTRKEVFLDVVKLHFRELLLCGVIVFIFSLPMHILKLLEDAYIANVSSSLPNDATAQQISDAEGSIIVFKNFKAIIGIPLMLVFSIGFAGLMRIIRQYAWEENVFFFNDFFKGIKQNAKHTLLLGLTVSVMYAICVYYYNTAPQDEGAVSFMFLIPVGIFILIVIPISAYMTVCIPVYTNTFRQNCLMGLYIFGKSPIKTLAVLAAFSLIFVSYIMSGIYAHLLGRLFCSFVSPFIMLAWYLFAYNQLDKHVNSKGHPELVGKGTFDKTQ